MHLCVSQVYRATLYQDESYLNSIKKKKIHFTAINLPDTHLKNSTSLLLKALLYRPATDTFVVVPYRWYNKEPKVHSCFSCSFAQLAVIRADKNSIAPVNTVPGSPPTASSDVRSET